MHPVATEGGCGRSCSAFRAGIDEAACGGAHLAAGSCSGSLDAGPSSCATARCRPLNARFRYGPGRRGAAFAALVPPFDAAAAVRGRHDRLAVLPVTNTLRLSTHHADQRAAML